jgi:hypothetical protein
MTLNSIIAAEDEEAPRLHINEESIEVVAMETTGASNESTSLLQHRHNAQLYTMEEQQPLQNRPHTGATLWIADANGSRSFSRSVSDHWDGYVSKVESHPLLTKSATATVILACADMCAQGLEHVRGTTASDQNGGVVDWLRVARFAAFGLLGAPWSHVYFHWLDHYLPPSPQPWSSTTALKVCIDQFLQAPLLLAVMISALSLMKGEGFAGVKRDLGNSYIDALIANCKYSIDSDEVFIVPSSLVSLIVLAIHS